MKAAVGTPTGSCSASGTRGSNVLTASYDSAPTAPPVKRGIPSVGRTRRFGRKSRIAWSGSGASDGSEREVRGVVADGHRSRLDPGRAIAHLQEPPWPDAKERVATGPLPALDRLEEVRRAAVIEAQEGADRGLQVRGARGAQQHGVGVGGEALGLRQADRIGGGHRGWPQRIRKRPFVPGTKGRAFRGATLIRRVPHSS